MAEPDVNYLSALREGLLEACMLDASPVALQVAGALSRGEVDSLVLISNPPGDATNAHRFRTDELYLSLFRKYEKLHSLGFSSLDPEKQALDDFLSNDRSCGVTNETFKHYFWNQSLIPESLFAQLQRVASVIREALPRKPSSRGFRFGPGSTSAVGGKHVALPFKLLALPECTRSVVSKLRYLDTVSEVWADLLARVHPNAFHTIPFDPRSVMFGPTRPTRVFSLPLIRGGKVQFAEKTISTKRVIIIEPHGNQALQLSLGSQLADCLSGLGISKEFQQTRQRHLAYRASIDGRNTTIDHSAASDLISYWVVALLFKLAGRMAWFHAMDECRSPSVQLPNGDWLDLEKFSSMGNGFTFELETLIFYAMGRAVSSDLEEVGTFGDDLIISTERVESYIELAQDLGFRINTKKTVRHDYRGGFSESCGADHLFGTDVRPVFLKGELSDEMDVISLCNRLRNFGTIPGTRDTMDPGVYRMYRRLVAALPSSMRLYGPVCDGDQWLHSDDRNKYAKRLKTRRGLLYLVGVRRKALETISYGRFCDLTRYCCNMFGTRTSEWSVTKRDMRLVTLEFDVRGSATSVVPCEYVVTTLTT